MNELPSFVNTYSPTHRRDSFLIFGGAGKKSISLLTAELNVFKVSFVGAARFPASGGWTERKKRGQTWWG